MVNEKTGGKYLSKERIPDSASVFIKKKHNKFSGLEPSALEKEREMFRKALK